jgi:hypothetical protein
MNAVADDIREPEIRIHGMDRAWLEDSLNNWGNWIEEHSDFEGYPRADAINSWVEGFGGGSKGHRILCVVMPKRVQSIHLRICNALTEGQRAAVWLQYVPRMKPNGGTWSIEERCDRAGVDRDTHRRTLHRARARLLGLAAA